MVAAPKCLIFIDAKSFELVATPIGLQPCCPSYGKVADLYGRGTPSNAAQSAVELLCRDSGTMEGKRFVETLRVFVENDVRK